MQSIIPGESVGWEGEGEGRAWASFDTPAYVRRGLTVETEWNALADKLHRTWKDWTVPVGRLCSQLRHQAGGLDAFGPWLASPEDLDRLRQLDQRLDHKLKYPPGKAFWHWPLKGSLRRLARMAADLNHAWARHLETQDLEPLNRSREQYNRWYLLEKECAMRSTRLAAGGFEPFPRVGPGDLIKLFPPLPVFRVR